MKPVSTSRAGRVEGWRSATEAAYGNQGVGDSDHSAELKDYRKKKGFQKYLNKKNRAREYMNGLHEYQLKRGDSPFGKTQIMTGAEAHAKNLSYEDKFTAALDAKKECRLWRLFVVNKFIN